MHDNIDFDTFLRSTDHSKYAKCVGEVMGGIGDDEDECIVNVVLPYEDDVDVKIGFEI